MSWILQGYLGKFNFTWKKALFVSSLYFSFEKIFEVLISHKDLLWPQDISLSCSKDKVTWWKSALLLTDLYILYGKAVEILTLYNDCILPVGITWLWPNIIWASSMLLEGNVNNFCPVFYLSYLETLEILNSHKDCSWPEPVS